MTEKESNNQTSVNSAPSYGHRWALLIAMMVGTVAAVMSSAIFNIAVPDLSRYFGIGQDLVQWVSSGFMAANTAAMLTAPWLLARFGYRKVYYGCAVFLMVGGLIGGLAMNFSIVLLARVIEGLAAGVMMPIGGIIVMEAFQVKEQGRATGIYSAGVVLAPALAPTVGGILLETMGWRSIFFMVLPFCVASLWLARLYVPHAAPGGAVASRSGAAELDWTGLLLASAGTVFILHGMIHLQSGQTGLAALFLGATLITFCGFLAWQVRLKRRKAVDGIRLLMDLDLFRYRQFSIGCIVSFTYGAALYGSIYLLPVYLQVGLGLTPTLAGSLLFPAGLTLAASVTLAGRMADYVSPHKMVSGGLLLLGASFVLVELQGLNTPLFWMAVFPALGRVGLGLVLPSLNLGSIRGLPPDTISEASSSMNFLRMVGGTIGVSLCGVALQWRLSAHGVRFDEVTLSVTRLLAFNEVFFLLALLCAIAMLAAWWLRPMPVEQSV